MVTFDRIALGTAFTPAELWPQAAQAARAWMQAHGVAVRDAIVLVPFAQLLAPARRAFAALEGWMPRVETTHTLSAALASQPAATDAGPSGDPGLDRLRATALLRNQTWARDWERRDRRGFAHGVSSMVDAAQLLQRAAAAVQPAARAAWWADARLACDRPGWPGDAIERALLQTAVAWASVSTAPASDVLFAQRPSAFVMVEAGGADPVAAAVLAHAAARGIAAASLVADSMTEDPFAVDWPAQSPQRRLCPDGEVEAWAAASLVIDAVNSGATPVALIAEDRLLARRVRALLERVGIAVDDETGWTLSTTRAAAHLMGLLRAASAHAGTDQLLDWLIDDCDSGDRDALIALEAAWRERRAPDSSAADLWARQRKRLDRLAEPARRPLQAWLATLNDLIQTGKGSQRWRDDPASRQMRSTLRLDTEALGSDWTQAASVSMDLGEFTAWADATLDRSQFVPPAGDAPVTITPLARALLRPFASVIVPGADELRLGPGTPVPALLGDSALRRLGMPDRQERWRRRARCFVALLRSPNVTLLRRAVEGDEPLAPSPLTQQAVLARRTVGRATDPERPAELAAGEIPLAPVCAPMPNIANRLPKSLSASSVNALRECPYRFFTQAVLRLREREEFDTEPGQRDYGNWLHATLQRFHDTRTSPLPPALEVERLQQVAEMTIDALGLDRAALLPFRAGLADFARRYIAWLHQRDGEGWHYRAGEQGLESLPPPLQGTGLHGRIDRIDEGRDKAVQLIDYKTSSPARLKQRLREPLEDAQLAFYAALIGDRLGVDHTLSAGYLALDDRAAVELFSPTQVQADAQQLIQGLSRDLQHMRAGAPLRALGAPPVCDWCEVRGLCRRDHWAPNGRGSAERS